MRRLNDRPADRGDADRRDAGLARLRRCRQQVVMVLIAVVTLTGCATAAPPSVITPPPTASAPPPATVAPTMAPATPLATPAPTTVPATPAADVIGITDAAPTLAPGTTTPAPPAAPSPPTPTAMAAGAEAVLAYYGTSGRREIALTFDAGADRGNAEAILDLLQAEGIRASFGLLGQWAEAHPDLVQRMVDEGHMLFNHSWTHASISGRSTGAPPLTLDEVRAELRQTEEVVMSITGVSMRPYFRPPYGDYTEESLPVLAEAGYPILLMWSCDSRDSLGATGQEILADCIVDAQPGRIVLLHVGAQSAAYDVLPEMIAMLREQGFTFVTADEILRP